MDEQSRGSSLPSMDFIFPTLQGATNFETGKFRACSYPGGVDDFLGMQNNHYVARLLGRLNRFRNIDECFVLVVRRNGNHY